MVLKHSSSDRAQAAAYLRWVTKYTSRGERGEHALHELTLGEMEAYHTRYVVPNLPPESRQRFLQLYAKVVQLRRSAMGTAMGQVIPPRRTQMFLEMWGQNREALTDRIAGGARKAIIFSVFLPVVQRIAADLNAAGCGTVLVTGATTDRAAKLAQFRGDDSIQAVAATSQTLQAGVTLVEANQVYFFGTPWRQTDMEQASDRAHRIGQTSQVDVWNAVLKDERPNLSSRMQDILDWSGSMVGAMIDPDAATGG